MDILIIIALALATFGLTDLITKQNGPLHIFKRWRDYFGRNKPDINSDNDNDEDWELYERMYTAWERSLDGQLYELFNCPFCLGSWIAGIVVVVVYTGIGWYTLVYWLSVYGLHSIICRKVY